MEVQSCRLLKFVYQLQDHLTTPWKRGLPHIVYIIQGDDFTSYPKEHLMILLPERKQRPWSGSDLSNRIKCTDATYRPLDVGGIT